MNDKIKTWQMSKPGNLAMTLIDMPRPKEGEVIVKIAGCGVCHTDIGYFYDGVPTVTQPPLTLGHEISGTVVYGDPKLIGKEVIITAVMPCGECEICRQGRENRCLKQKMPGNSLGIYGGFSSHIPVPSKDLCVVDERAGIDLADMAVIADAVTTPYQAAKRVDLKQGDVVIITGAAGGVGSYMTQIARAFGAKFIIGIEYGNSKVEKAEALNIDLVIDSKENDVKEIKKIVKERLKTEGIGNFGLKIFEVTGNAQAQLIALSLLTFISKLAIIGYGMAKNSFMFSKLMAYDAEIIGTWGCKPKYYPKVLKLVTERKILIEPYVEKRPMSQIEKTFKEAKEGKLEKRVVLIPDFD